MNSRKLIFFHSYNDYSGSPNVLSSVIRGLSEKGFSIDLYTSSSEIGHLSGISDVNYHRVSYRFSPNRALTLFRYIILQARLFFIAFKYLKDPEIIFYINTILPFGAALGGKLIHKRVIYHVHENPVVKNFIHRIAILVFKKCADKAIFVSEYLYNSYKIDINKKILIYNALSLEFVKIAERNKPVLKQPLYIMMACSLKKYKGVDVLIELAKKLQEYRFILAMNASDSDIRKYFRGKMLPQNIDLICGQNDLHPYYKKSNLVVNLSNPDLFVESFGLTALESLTYGIPVIVPPAGGIIEMVEDGINGYIIDPRNEVDLIKIIHMIFSDEEKYLLLSSNARQIAKKFSFASMISKIELVLVQ